MSATYCLNKNEININEKASLIKKEMCEEYLTWYEVYYTTKDREIFLGSYYSDNYTTGNIYYNNNYVIITKYCYDWEDEKPKIETVFDLNNECFIEGTQEELFKIYKENFTGRKLKKS